MTETDAEFVERMFGHIILRTSDFIRLKALAHRGAAVQWRPSDEARNATHSFEAAIIGGSCQYKDCPDLQETFSVPMSADWIAAKQRFETRTFICHPTHYIPLSALGEPDHAEAVSALAEYTAKGGISLEQLKTELGEPPHE